MLVLEWLNNLDKITFKSDTYINLPQRCAPLYYTDLLQLKLFSIGIFECRDPVGLVILVLNWMMWFYTNVSVNFGKVYPLWKKKCTIILSRILLLQTFFHALEPHNYGERFKFSIVHGI